MRNEKQLLYEAKTEWKGLMLETKLRAYREDYGEQELNEVLGALKKAGGWIKDRVKSMFGAETSKQADRRKEKEAEKEAKKEYMELHGDLKGFGSFYKGKKGTVKTWGQLKDILDIANNVKELESAQKKAQAGGAATRTLFPALTIVLSAVNPALGGALGVMEKAAEFFGGVKNARDAAATLRDATDSQVESSPLLDLFKIDDGYQDIVDPKIEDKFLKWFSKWIEKNMKGNPDGEVPAIDINTLFEKFLKEDGNPGFDETVTGAVEDTKLNQIPYNGKPSEVKQAWNKVTRSMGGYIDEFM